MMDQYCGSAINSRQLKQKKEFALICGCFQKTKNAVQSSHISSVETCGVYLDSCAY